MATLVEQDDPFVLLHGIPWEQYEKITDSLARYRLRHTYDRGTLEMRGLLYGVSWADYTKFLEALGDYNLRHTYDGGTLEMMSPRKDHDWTKKLLARMIETMTYDQGLAIQSVGSTTLMNADAEKSLQPDESYYIQSEPKVRFKATYDPDTDPPPDLAIEVDVTSSSLPRMPVFTKLKIPEVWRFYGDRLHIFHRVKSGRSRGKYLERPRSIAFPYLTANDITDILNKWNVLNEFELVEEFVLLSRKLRSKHQSLKKRRPKKGGE